MVRDADAAACAVSSCAAAGAHPDAEKMGARGTDCPRTAMFTLTVAAAATPAVHSRAARDGGCVVGVRSCCTPCSSVPSRSACALPVARPACRLRAPSSDGSRAATLSSLYAGDAHALGVVQLLFRGQGQGWGSGVAGLPGPGGRATCAAQPRTG